MFENIPEAMIFGEDVGKIGGVNQGVEGLQERYGETRVADTGIRETTILGQGIGMSLRGLRPIAEMQYLDYLLYAFQTMADDIASLHYRTHGGQISPVIIRTRGHRLGDLAFRLSNGYGDTWNKRSEFMCAKKYDKSGRFLQYINGG